MSKEIQSKIDKLSRAQKIKLVSLLLKAEAKCSSPDSFRAFIVGLLANFFYEMADEDFEMFCAVHPCNQAGCNCHIIAGEAAKFFRLLRADIREELCRRAIKKN